MKFTKAIKNKITKDWAVEFPSFEFYKPLMLIRRVGCLVQGLCLNRDRNNNNYSPTLFIFSLCRKHPTIGLTTAQTLKSYKGSVEIITVSGHETTYSNSASRLKKASILPIAEPWNYTDIVTSIERYRNYVSMPEYDLLLYIEDVAYTAAYYGRISLAHEIFDKYHDEIKSFQNRFFVNDKDFLSWENRVRREVENSIEINTIVNQQISNLKLENIKFSPIYFE